MKDLRIEAYSAPLIKVLELAQESSVCQASRPDGYNGNSWGDDFDL